MLGDTEQATMPVDTMGQTMVPAGYDGQVSMADKSSDKMSEKDSDGYDKPTESEKAYIKSWQSRIKAARKKWAPDFDRMRENMDFVSGIQWKGQKGISYDHYVVNLTLRIVNQGVAMIYARNPKVEAKRRKRMDFQVWDEHMETIIETGLAARMAQMQGLPVPPELMALINDFQQGRLRQQLVDKVGRTLEIVYQYQMDTQQPSFKLQMKQLVRRVRVCGVGYIKVDFCRNYESDLTQSETRMSVADRMKMAKEIWERIEKGKIDELSPEVEQLKSLIVSLQNSPLDAESVQIKEHLTFDFPRATSIIPDPDTRTLKGFVGSRWLVEEMYYPLNFVNAFFECDIKPSSDIKFYGRDNKTDEGYLEVGEKQDNRKRKVCLWTVWDLDTKSTFVLCEGYEGYVVKPELVTPATKGFWTIVPVTFNDIEVEEGCKASIFPPSDVDLIKSTQREWNRTREALRKHRKANEPRYLYPDGAITEEDLDRLESSEGQQFVKLKGLQPGAKPTDVIQPLNVAPVKPELYNTDPLREDTLLATGQQEANLGPPQPNVTATGNTIAEQSRMSVASSDTDGLDDSLTEVAQIGGEMLLKEMSTQTVKHIAGVGAVWPEQNREDFINELELEVVAASSGRPNKAVEIANWQQLAPLLLQAQANPQAVIRETIKRADDRLDPAEFFPLPLPPMAPPSESANGPAVGPGGGASTKQAQVKNNERKALPPPSTRSRGEGQMYPSDASEPGQEY